MKKHSTDLFALLFGLAFAIAGAAVIASQASSADISPQWIAATGLIVLGAVALATTLLRSQHDADERAFSPFDADPLDVAPLDVAPVADDPESVSPADPAG